MIFFSDARLKEVEFEVIEDCHTKFQIDKDKRRLYWTFGCFFGWLVIDLVMLFILKPTTGDSDVNYSVSNNRAWLTRLRLAG